MGECTCATGRDEGFDPAPLDAVLAEHASTADALIPLLQATQRAYGYLPEDAMRRIAVALGRPLSAVFGVATFYAQFHLTPRGRRIVRVCHGTACHVKGALAVTEALVDELGVAVGRTADDRSVTLESVACVGCCGLGPIVLVDGEPHGDLDAKSTRKLAKSIKRGRD